MPHSLPNSPSGAGGAPDSVHLIPLSEIEASALTRDRTGLDEAPLTELRLSIAAGGLRMPVELWPLPEPRPTPDGLRRYGLLSGYRRLHAFHALHELTGEPRYAAIPAFLRPARSTAEALAAMVEENEIRAGLSPWERGRIAWTAWRQEVFPTVEEAVERLYPSAPRQKRARLRAFAHVVDELDGLLAAPERLNQRQMLRLSAALQSGFAEPIREALYSASRASPEAQWDLILPYLAEAEQLPAETAPPPREGYPRRLARIRHGLTLRRAMTTDGWVLHFSGEEATCDFVSEIIDEVERLYGG